jgi:protein-S-isoprenylcysteine O-methyltransferase Ste14
LRPDSPYARIFGAGPLGGTVSIALLGGAAVVAARTPELGFHLAAGIRWAILIAGAVAGAGIILWSVRSLPVGERGRSFCVSGPFYWVRHPLYAAFLSVFNPALAIALDHPVYLGWAVILHPLWHVLIRPEERLLEEYFGGDYRIYASHTGRFVPRPGRP